MISVVIISKDEIGLDGTLADVVAQAQSLAEPCEVVVVDASGTRLDQVRSQHAAHVRWLDFRPPAKGRTSIPQQRNAGVKAAAGEIIAFTDVGCAPEAGWLDRLTAPLLAGEEQVTAGVTRSAGDGVGLYDRPRAELEAQYYLPECPTINMAFNRQVFDAVRGFDEQFAYGSDIDFSWRLVDAGYR